MTENELLYHKIASDLPDAKEGKIFGAKCIKASNGKACAIFWKDNMLFKLDKNSQTEALGLEGASPGFHLYAPDKPMKGWVMISSEQSDKWKLFTSKAIEFVQSR